jgi:hypothetical protein
VLSRSATEILFEYVVFAVFIVAKVYGVICYVGVGEVEVLLLILTVMNLPHIFEYYFVVCSTTGMMR